MNKFSFHPVGQGLFYTGSLLNGYYNFVYDCGTNTSTKRLDEIIDNYTDGIKEIDFIIISHLHEDHFNGIPNLIASCVKKKINIKKIILPYVYGFKNVVIASVVNSLSNIKKQNLNENIKLLSWINLMYSEKRLYNIPVEFISGEEKNIFENTINFMQNEKEFWKFHVLNKTQPYSNCEKLNKEISDLLKAEEQDIFKYICKKGIKALKEIRAIYKKAMLGGLNVTSTVLLHYPMFNTYSTTITEEKNLEDYLYLSASNQKCCIQRLNNKVEISKINRTLLTGDAEFDNYMLNCVNGIMKDTTGIMQVPHHGSIDNWNKIQNLEKNFTKYVIPFGLGNTSKHPSIDTIADISKNKKNTIYEVNQLRGMYYYIH